MFPEIIIAMEEKNILKASVKINWQVPAILEINKSAILGRAGLGRDGNILAVTTLT